MSDTWIGAYTDLIGTIEILRRDMRDGFILGWRIEPRDDRLFDVYTEWNPTYARPSSTPAAPKS
jgi:hypothetical protein